MSYHDRTFLQQFRYALSKGYEVEEIWAEYQGDVNFLKNKIPRLYSFTDSEVDELYCAFCTYEYAAGWLDVEYYYARFSRWLDIKVWESTGYYASDWFSYES